MSERLSSHCIITFIPQTDSRRGAPHGPVSPGPSVPLGVQQRQHAVSYSKPSSISALSAQQPESIDTVRRVARPAHSRTAGSIAPAAGRSPRWLPWQPSTVLTASCGNSALLPGPRHACSTRRRGLVPSDACGRQFLCCRTAGAGAHWALQAAPLATAARRADMRPAQ